MSTGLTSACGPDGQEMLSPGHKAGPRTRGGEKSEVTRHDLRQAPPLSGPGSLLSSIAPGMGLMSVHGPLQS